MKISDLSVQQKKTVLIIIGIGVVLLTALIVAAMLMIGGTDVKPAGGSNTILQDSSVPETEDDESVLQLESIYVSDQTVSKENSTSGNQIPVTVESNSGTSSTVSYTHLLFRSLLLPVLSVSPKPALLRMSINV